MNLTKHFTLAELTANSHNITNQPDADQLLSLGALCEHILEPVRMHFNSPLIITSGFRSPELNKLVGGVPTSQHAKGEAADFHVKGVANDVVWRYIKDSLVFDQVIAERLSRHDGQAGWVHCSFIQGKPNRMEALSFLGNGKYVPELVYID